MGRLAILMAAVLASTAAIAAPTMSVAPAASVRPAAQDVRLTGSHPCPDQAGFTCSTLRVPLDHHGADRRALDLAVAVEDKPAATHILLLLTGGPGQPGVPFATRLSSKVTATLPDYRMVLIDQRGTGATALQCPELQEQMGATDLAVPTPQAVTDCATAIGPDRRFYGTADTVADLDELRSALGADTTTVDGVSYGTYVAERYAITYPNRVAKVVLDSVLPDDAAEPLSQTPMHASGRVLRAICAARSCPGDPVADLAKTVRMRTDGSEILNALTIDGIVDPDYTGVPEMLHDAAQGNFSHLDGLIAGVHQGSADTPENLSQAACQHPLRRRAMAVGHRAGTAPATLGDPARRGRTAAPAARTPRTAARSRSACAPSRARRAGCGTPTQSDKRSARRDRFVARP